MSPLLTRTTPVQIWKCYWFWKVFKKKYHTSWGCWSACWCSARVGHQDRVGATPLRSAILVLSFNGRVLTTQTWCMHVHVHVRCNLAWCSVRLFGLMRCNEERRPGGRSATVYISDIDIWWSWLITATVPTKWPLQHAWTRHTPSVNRIDLIWYLVAASFQPYTTPRTNLFRPSRVPAVQKATKDMQADDFPDPNCTITVYTEKTRVVGFISEWINAYTFISRKYLRGLRYRCAPV